VKASAFNSSSFEGETKRQLDMIGMVSLSKEEMRNLSACIASMGSIYGQVGQIIINFMSIVIL